MSENNVTPQRVVPPLSTNTHPDANSSESDVTTPVTATSGTKKRRISTPLRWGIAILALVVVVGGGFAGYSALFAAGPQIPRTMSQTVSVSKQAMNETVGVDGKLAPAKQAQLNFPVSGTVTKVYKAVGDTVKKNEKLAEIDKTGLKNAVELAEANVASAKAAYNEAKSGSSANKKAAQAEVNSAKAGLKSAKENLKNAVLRAPYAGTIASVGISKGDTAGQGSQGSLEADGAAFTVVSPEAWQVEGTLPAADVAKVKAGQSANITLGEDLTPVKGTVLEVGIVASGASDGQATFPVKIKLDEERSDLYSGTSASAAINISDNEPVLVIPSGAVTTENGQPMATLAASNQMVPIEIGKTLGQWTEITKGLAEGDEVIITITLPEGVEGQDIRADAPMGGFGGMPGIAGGRPGGGRAQRASGSTQSGQTVTVKSDGNGEVVVGD